MNVERMIDLISAEIREVQELASIAASNVDRANWAGDDVAAAIHRQEHNRRKGCIVGLKLAYEVVTGVQWEDRDLIPAR